MKACSPHGTGATVDPDAHRLERGKVEDQPYPPTAVADPLQEGRDRNGRVRNREAAAALARLPRRRDVLPEQIACHPDFERHYRARLEWRDRRRAELLVVGRGVLSHGVGARLDRAAWLFAGSEFASERASKTGYVALFATAGALAAQADRLDWSAYHMAVREAQLRSAVGVALPPWMRTVEGDLKEPPK